ncbi:MAG: hypothetical protein QOG77_1000 [Solirubrobacteraceae bacterium]|jgi:hypothetical protein|nr:hypothetical protein [Solirubrobacteraceae bacterium]
MERPEAGDAPLADDSGPVPVDMPLEPADEAAERRPDRTEEQTAEPRPDRHEE